MKKAIFCSGSKITGPTGYEEADVIILVLDARRGLSPEDEQVADILRRQENL